MVAVIMSKESKMYRDNLNDDQDNTESVSKTANQEDVNDNIIIGSLILVRLKLIDAWNRYAFKDEDVPEWFVQGELNNKCVNMCQFLMYDYN